MIRKQVKQFGSLAKPLRSQHASPVRKAGECTCGCSEARRFIFATKYDSRAFCGQQQWHRQVPAQIQIAAEAIVVKTIEAEHGPGVLEVGLVFDFTDPAEAFWIERFQKLKSLTVAQAHFGAPIFLFLGFGSFSK